MPIQKTKNKHFFKKWSPKMAYVLGFFAADGCMIKNKRGAHFIEFQITDKDILLKIRKLLGSNHKITKRNNTNCKTAYRLQIGSMLMFKDLLFLGMTPTKSKTIKMPNIPEKYFCHFARGYFDGDGSVCITQYIRANRKNKLSTALLSGFTSGSREFLKELHNKLRTSADISGGTLCRYSGAFRLFFSVNDSVKLYKFMYTGIDRLFLQRKKKVFEKYFKMDR